MKANNNFFNTICKAFKSNNKNKLNLILSFNFYKNCVQIASVFGINLSTLKTSLYHFKNGALTQSGMAEFSQLLTELVAEYGATTAKSIHIILPDESVVLDPISLPQINGKMQERALLSVIEKDYENVNEICTKFSLFSKNKNSVNYIAASINNQIKSNILIALKNAGLKCTALTFSANCSANFALKIYPEIKRKSVLLIDESNEAVSFIAVVNGKAVSVYKTDGVSDESAKEKILFRMQDFAKNFNLTDNCVKIQEIVLNASNDLKNYLITNAKNLQISVLDCQEYKFTKNIALLGALFCAKSNEEFNFN
ncbi:MAG: hypothetical protein E7370_01775 [Clostridiales bacterium]|nr:hypothetical protein [Clostridiales bacterium]